MYQVCLKLNNIIFVKNKNHTFIVSNYTTDTSVYTKQCIADNNDFYLHVKLMAI